MLSFDTPTHRFHLRAAAVIRQGTRVLLHRLESDTIWALPGGRVEPGEESAATVLRELREELGLEAAVCRLLWVAENFFPHAGRHYHELGMYFEVTLPDDSPVLTGPGPYFGSESGVVLRFQWFALEELERLDVRPAFLKRALGSTSPVPRHFVFRDEADDPPPRR
ncbi:NUDIX domain-containing protein [Cystobacter fuscus]|uniref:NUDIX domain-containing protein n=1 Tax=Cystobacter fuscus TaxID=43 RepID=A0A250J822_9BACT|nr:NUDIX hydrolase [Cystobacter fuscus]ATB39743.1 NUDIX domain-containing protein [Cystobacter fuscus]